VCLTHRFARKLRSYGSGSRRPPPLRLL